jgi:hypothetical protein
VRTETTFRLTEEAGTFSIKSPSELGQQQSLRRGTNGYDREIRPSAVSRVENHLSLLPAFSDTLPDHSPPFAFALLFRRSAGLASFAEMRSLPTSNSAFNA